MSKMTLLLMMIAGFSCIGTLFVFLDMRQEVIEVQNAAMEVEWDDLRPKGAPYAKIIARGELDNARDIWKPVYDDNAFEFNDDLDGRRVKLPAFVVPLEVDETGTRAFLAVPFYGACVHVPPPPANQIVLVNSAEPWPMDYPDMPVYVTGEIAVNMRDTELAEVGYVMEASHIELMEIEMPAME